MLCFGWCGWKVALISLRIATAWFLLSSSLSTSHLFVAPTRLALFRFCIVVTIHCDLLIITSLGTIHRLNFACINVSINPAVQGAPTHNQKVLLCQQTKARFFY